MSETYYDFLYDYQNNDHCNQDFVKIERREIIFFYQVQAEHCLDQIKNGLIKS